MYHIQDVREAQQMWDHKFKNAGREGIVLRDGKPGLITRLLDLFTRDTPSKETSSESNLRKGYQAA